MNENLSGKTALVTGASSGIGLHSLIALARAGAAVIGVGRSAARCAEAEQTVRAACPEAQVRFLLADLSLQSEVRRLAADVRAALQTLGAAGLDVLVNNAGLFSGNLTRTSEGIELTLAVNHLAVFLLSHELLPQLRAAPGGRVITVSSNSHYNTRLNLKTLNQPLFYNGLLAYKISKLCNVLFTYEFNRRAAGSQLHAFAVDPGLVDTGIGQKGTGRLVSWFWGLRRRGGQPPEVPARTVLHLSADPGVLNAAVHYWYDLHPKAPSRYAQREDVARRLWAFSCQLCNLPDHAALG